MLSNVIKHIIGEEITGRGEINVFGTVGFAPLPIYHFLPIMNKYCCGNFFPKVDDGGQQVEGKLLTVNADGSR